MDYRDFEQAARAMDDINDALRGVDVSAVEQAADAVETVADARESMVTVADTLEDLVTVQDMVNIEDMVTIEDVFTVEDAVAELSSLLSRSPEIPTVIEELNRSSVESVQDAHAQLLAVHEITTGLTVRIPHAPAINHPSRRSATPGPTEPEPTERPPLTQEPEVPAEPRSPAPTVTLTEEELEALLARVVSQSKDPLVRLLIFAAATEMFATVVVDGVVYVVGLYFNGC